MTKYTKIPIHVYVITMDLQELKEDYKPINQNQIEYLEKMSENAGEEYSDYSELLESYWNISENPVNINSDNIDDNQIIYIFSRI